MAINGDTDVYTYKLNTEASMLLNIIAEMMCALGEQALAMKMISPEDLPILTDWIYAVEDAHPDCPEYWRFLEPVYVELLEKEFALDGESAEANYPENEPAKGTLAHEPICYRCPDLKTCTNPLERTHPRWEEFLELKASLPFMGTHHDFQTSEQAMLQMSLTDAAISSTMELFRENGWRCDCAIPEPTPKG